MHTGDGDGWVVLPDGSRRWGRYGASGLLLHATDPKGTGHVLLQHRAWWSHMGDTWGMPGGALNSGESAVQAALREFGEEVAGELGEIMLSGVHRQDHSVWRYDTVLARAAEKRVFSPGNNESSAIRWVPLDEVTGLRLLPAFGRIWPQIREALAQRLVLVVDVPTVLGHRFGGEETNSGTTAEAATRLRDDLATLAATGIDGTELPDGLSLAPLHRWFPHVRLLVEKGVPAPLPVPGIDVVQALGGPEADAEGAADTARIGRGPGALVATGRPALFAGSQVVSPQWLSAALNRVDGDHREPAG
ncbi:MAG: NUDIX hydrolase [Nocardiopsaceae bacterium]|nr:NUDIX hydrolase [Nocardiopsaceae bacterium]